jgi:hypothetical protein
MPRSTANEVSPTLLAVGPWDRGEFAAVRDQLDPHGSWPTARSLVDAWNRASDVATPPELILLAQARPGCDDQAEVERWRAAWPLARIIVVAGTWCEGELRTGRPLAGVVRLYWHEFAPWWREALRRLAAGGCPPWSTPLTGPGGAADLLSCGPSRHAIHFHQPVVAIDAVDFAVFESLEHALNPASWQCRWQPRRRPEMWCASGAISLVAGVFDGGQLDAHEQRDLERFCTRLQAAPVIALVDYPLGEHRELGQRCGAAGVFGKPYSVSALIAELARVSGVGVHRCSSDAEGRRG